MTTVFAERARHAHISKEHGFRFVWNDEAGMHVSTDVKPTGRPKAFDPHEVLAILRGEFLSHAEAFQRCSEVGWKMTTFKTAWKELDPLELFFGS